MPATPTCCGKLRTESPVTDIVDHWGPELAATYDADVADQFDPAVLGPTVEFLADLAAGGSALEFAVGTGRVALPLAASGVEVHGIELSAAMLDRLREKAGADAVEAHWGDMTSTLIGRRFDLAYLVFNTIMNLTTQDLQVALFQNAARHLVPGGCFVLEVIVPRIDRLGRGGRFVPFDVSSDHIGIDEYDVVTQRSVSHHVHIRDGVTSRSSMEFRYVWPSELDLMARVAGLRLRERWADWDRSEFTAESDSHVSVYELVPTR